LSLQEMPLSTAVLLPMMPTFKNNCVLSMFFLLLRQMFVQSVINRRATAINNKATKNCP
jgi:hypothetical protein